VQLGDRVVVLGARPSNVKRTLTFETPRGRAQASPGVVEAEQAIMEELGLT
jgi:ABC-type nitrate/sulfonate/bicarbonate transport system ATPase subunit